MLSGESEHLSVNLEIPLIMADLVLINGNVLTMNTQKPHAEAVAITKDRIVKVGDNSEIAQLISKDTQKLDLKGKTVVPGFIDTHIHVADFGRTLAWVDLKQADSIPALLTLVRKRAEKVGKGRWILGSGWNQENFKEKRYPTRRDLDVAAPENPAILYHQLGQTCVTNTKALRLADITKETASPKDGTIEKDPETREPTGILQGAATDLVWNKIPAPTDQETEEAAKEACRKIVEAGITSIHWIVASVAEMSIAQKLGANSQLPLRIFIIATAEVFENLPVPEPSERPMEETVKMGGVLIFVDGYLAAQTAALNAPYVGGSGNKGQLLYTQEELNRLMMRIRKADRQVIVHAMGDKAVDAALKAFAATSSAQSTKKNRNRLEQSALLNRQLIKRLRKLEIIVSVQPKVVESEFTVWSAREHLGEERARLLFPLKTLLRNDVTVVAGSDCPMEPLNPLLGIQALVARKDFPKERLTVEEALRLYTVNAAYATLEETEKGSIEEGKLADFTVLSGDPMTIPSEKLSDIKVEMTIIGGKIVHGKTAV